MRITHLELQNFRSYTEAAFDFTAPRTLIVGPNGSGKSTLVDAISWCLLGRCRGVDGRGAGQKELIRAGADTATVKLTVDGLGTVTRIVGRNGTATASLKPDMILAKLGATEGQLMAALYGGSFFQLHHADAKALLMALLDVRITPDQLPGMGLDGPITLDELQTRYDSAFQERAVAKKTLAAVAIPDEVPVPDGLDTNQVGVVDLLAVANASEKERARVAQSVGRLEGELKRLIADQAVAEQLIAGRVMLEGKVEAHADMLAQHQAVLEQARTKLAEVQAQKMEAIQPLSAEVAGLKSAIDRVGSQSVESPSGERWCVLRAGIPCLTPLADFVGEVKKMKGQVTALGKRIKAAQEQAGELAAAQAAVTEAERTVAYNQRQLNDAKAKLEATDQADARVKELADQMAAVGADLDVSREALKAATSNAEATRGQATALQHWQAVNASRKAAVAKRDALAAEVERLEGLVKLLGPNGIQNQALNDALAQFEEAINLALQGFGFSLGFSVNPWRVTVTTGTSPAALPFELLSKGEQLWTALAFQLALAMASGLDFLVVDDTESVVGQARQLLTGLVLQNPVGQVLVVMAKGPDDPIPNLEGLQVIRL